ncbi:MAG: hypothetical protein KME29_04655 [Calothrix sp. FI2-JRJ7]|jgi:hypothetical protein|nr:hypothetical protein [Calothrix sp. FI2-JRJ7]
MKTKPLTDTEIFQLVTISELDIERAIKIAHPTLKPFLEAGAKQNKPAS